MKQAEAAVEIKAVTGAEFAPCYQCTRCSVGCPAQSRMEFKPNQVIRLLQYGRAEELLASRTIWACVGCQTCTSRCPNEVDVAGIMDALRNLALARRVPPGLPDVAAFHRVFLADVRRRGRIHEPGMIARFKLATWQLFKDTALGMKMFFRGKLRLMPRGVKRKREIREIFKAAGRPPAETGEEAP